MEKTLRAAWTTFLLSVRNSYRESHTEVPRLHKRKFRNFLLGYFSLKNLELYKASSKGYTWPRHNYIFDWEKTLPTSHFYSDEMCSTWVITTTTTFIQYCFKHFPWINLLNPYNIPMKWGNGGWEAVNYLHRVTLKRVRVNGRIEEAAWISWW